MSTRENGRERADSVIIPRGVNTHPLGAAPHAGNGTRLRGGLQKTGGCPGIEGAGGGVTSTAHSALYSIPPRRYPVGQPIVFGDLSSGTVIANLGSHSGVPNLFGLPAPVYTGTVPAGASSTVPTAVASVRSVSAARVDKSVALWLPRALPMLPRSQVLRHPLSHRMSGQSSATLLTKLPPLLRRPKRLERRDRCLKPQPLGVSVSSLSTTSGRIEPTEHARSVTPPLFGARRHGVLL